MIVFLFVLLVLLIVPSLAFGQEEYAELFKLTGLDLSTTLVLIGGVMGATTVIKEAVNAALTKMFPGKSMDIVQGGVTVGLAILLSIVASVKCYPTFSQQLLSAIVVWAFSFAGWKFLKKAGGQS